MKLRFHLSAVISLKCKQPIDQIKTSRTEDLGVIHFTNNPQLISRLRQDANKNYFGRTAEKKVQCRLEIGSRGDD